ncbi:unnamed protein product, partial [Meganyctiphanes norvegica]
KKTIFLYGGWIGGPYCNIYELYFYKTPHNIFWKLSNVLNKLQNVSIYQMMQNYKEKRSVINDFFSNPVVFVLLAKTAKKLLKTVSRDKFYFYYQFIKIEKQKKVWCFRVM